MKKTLLNGKEFNYDKIIIKINGIPIVNCSEIRLSKSQIAEIRACVPPGILESIRDIEEETLLQYNISLYNKGKFETHKL